MYSNFSLYVVSVNVVSLLLSYKSSIRRANSLLHHFSDVTSDRVSQRNPCFVANRREASVSLAFLLSGVAVEFCISC